MSRFLKFGLLGLLWMWSASGNAETRLDWEKLNRLVPAWPIVDVAEAIPSNLISHWESQAVSFRCPSIPGSFDAFPTKYDPNSPNGGCNHLDATLFNGLLCASGSEEGCRAVRQSQRADGEWFRSPLNRRYSTTRCKKVKGFPNEADQCGECINTFSPDHGLGAMLYIVKKRDVQALKRWLASLEKIGETTTLCKADGSCQSFPWPRLCSNDKGCTIRNADGSLNEPASKIPTVIGGFTSGMCILIPVKDTPDYDLLALKEDVQLGKLMLRAANDGDALLAVLTGTAAGVVVPDPLKDQVFAKMSNTNFPLHLEATRVFLRMLINNPDLTMSNLPKLPLDPSNIGLLPNSPQNSLSPVLLHERAQEISNRQKWNPFYKLLADGPSADARQMILNLCPAQGESLPKNRPSYLWRWETDVPAEFDKNHSMGWDCVFVGRLFNKMRTQANLGKELLALFDKFADPLPLIINDAKQRLAEAQKVLTVAADTAQAASAALQSVRDYVNNQYPALSSQLQQSSQSVQQRLNADLANAANLGAQARAKAQELASKAPCPNILIPDGDTGFPFYLPKFRTVPEPICEAARNGLVGTINFLNNQLDAANNALLAFNQQLQAIDTQLNAAAAKLTQESLKLADGAMEAAEKAAVQDLRDKQKLVTDIGNGLTALSSAHEQATGYLKVWRRL